MANRSFQETSGEGQRYRGDDVAKDPFRAQTEEDGPAAPPRGPRSSGGRSRLA